jgi:3-keto-5-aminohexanoate cleavage enzyme
MGRKIVVTAALTGAVTMKDANPNVPYTPEEFVREAKRVEEVGGAIVHIHCRDPKTGLQTSDPAIVKEVVEGIRENTNLLVNLSTGGGGPGVTLETRKRPISEQSPDLASLNVGSMNFCLVDFRTGKVLYDLTFENKFETIIWFGELMKEKRVKPELECYDLGHVHNVHFFMQYYDFLVKPLHFSIVLGVVGGMRFNTDTLNSFVHALPEGSTWQGIGVGPFCFPVAMASAIFGGHIRVGLEDNLYIDYDTKTLAKGSWEQVEKVIQMIRLLGHEPATPAEARTIYHLPQKE